MLDLSVSFCYNHCNYNPETLKMKKILSALLAAALLLLSTGCGTAAKTPTIEGATNMVQIELEDGGIIKIELYPDIAPITVANFQKLVSENFYDGIIFHRVIKNFMIQCGDPTGTGYYGSNETIKGEFSSNGVQNTLSHTRGVVSMARSSASKDSASSQFFIVHKDFPSLDGKYAAFGKVVSGMDVVDRIASAATNSSDKPLTDIVIKTITFVEK